MKKIILSSALCLTTLLGAEIVEQKARFERAERFFNGFARLSFNLGIGVVCGAIYEGITSHESIPFNAKEEVSLQAIVTLCEGFIGEGGYYLTSVGNKQKHMAHVSSGDLLVRGAGRAIAALVAYESKQANDKRIVNGKVYPWGLLNSDLILGAVWTVGKYGLDRFSGSKVQSKKQPKQELKEMVYTYQKAAVTPAPQVQPQPVQQVPSMKEQIETTKITPKKSADHNVTAEVVDAGSYFEQLRSM